MFRQAQHDNGSKVFEPLLRLPGFLKPRSQVFGPSRRNCERLGPFGNRPRVVLEYEIQEAARVVRDGNFRDKFQAPPAIGCGGSKIATGIFNPGPAIVSHRARG